MSSPSTFALYGLRITSDMPVRAPLAELQGAPDFTILRGDDLPSDYPPPPGEVWAAEDFGNGVSVRLAKTVEGWSLLYPHRAEVRFAPDLRTATLHAAPGTADLLPLLLASSVPTWWLNLRGESVLHASAVAVDDRALAFIGASGMGKSTLATLLCAHGATLITDDALRLMKSEAGFDCHFGPGELRLRPGAATLAGLFPPECAQMSVDGRTTLRLATLTPKLTQLVAIVIPQPSREATALRVERLSPVQASFHLISYSRVICWQAEGPLRRQFEWFSDLARRVPVSKLSVPWGPPFGACLPGQLLDMLQVEFFP